MAFLAFDDTDSRAGGCTTHLAWRIVQALEDVDLVGPPELVRLNPNVPFKTRGNGALCLRVGHGEGRPTEVGVDDDGGALLAYPKAREPDGRELRAAFAAAGRILNAERRRDPSTRPGLVAGWDPPPESFYWQAVRSLVGGGDARRVVVAHATHWRAWNGGRGLLGAMAAAAWRGRHDATYEAIAYREPDRVGTRRDVDPATVEPIDAEVPGCFDSWDPVHRVARAVPASPCPVLFGVRGERLDAVAKASERPGPEAPDGSLVFRTNQATDDHVASDGWAPYASLATVAEVAGRPRSRRGGHVFVRMAAADGRRFDAAAYEPTKALRTPVRALRPGDAVRVVGSLHRSTGTLALEKLWLDEAAPRVERVKPTCPTCGNRMRSRGRGAGFRCRHGHATRPETAAVGRPLAREVAVGAFEVPVLARRHLAKPLARGQNSWMGRRPA